jgi:RNA polymerase sigma factor (sigma-70 family)
MKEVCIMAEKEKYIINIQGQLVEVTPDVYYLYFRMERQERGQEEKKQRNDVVSYDALDNGETVGAEALRDMASPSLEELAITHEIYEKLHRAVEALPRAERELIQAIYFNDEKPETYAARIGMTVRGVNKRRSKILTKLKMFMDFMGSF